MEKIRFKQVLNHQNKPYFMGFVGGFILILYALSGAFSYQSPMRFNFLSIENQIPFLTWTIWVNLIGFALFLSWGLKLLQNLVYLNKLIYVLISACIMAFILNFLFPIYYPWHISPLPFEDSRSLNLIRGTRFLISNTHGIISFQVIISNIIRYFLSLESKDLKIKSNFLFILIVMSSLTLKHIYIMEVIFSLGLSSLLCYIFKKFIH